MYRRLRAARRAGACDHRVWIVGATAAAFALAVFGFSHIPQQFFPTSERTELFVQLRMPEGSAIGATLAAAKQAEQLIAGDDDAATWTTYIGPGPPRFWLGLNPALPNEAYAEIVIVAKDIKARERLKTKIDTAVAKVRAEGARADRPLQFRPAGRLSRPVPRDRHRSAEGPLARLPGSRHRARQSRRGRAAARLGRADALGEARARPGPHPRARPRPADGLRRACRRSSPAIRSRPCATAPRRSPWWRARSRASATISARSATSPCSRATACRCPSRRSRISSRDTKTRSHGAATAIWRSRCAPTFATACRPPTSRNAIWANLEHLRSTLPTGYRIEMGGAIEEFEQGQCLAVRDLPGHDHGDAGHPHGPAAELLAARAHAADRAARADRRHRRPARSPGCRSAS